jgi:hypothetical protein
MKDELPFPTQVNSSKRSMELARIWIIDGDQYVVLSSSLWDDPALWGLMLVDVARHVSKAYASKGKNEEDVLKRIKNAFDSEWESPTS